jgi:electron transfer flavoprotein-quinone oxidoreductase
VYSNGLVIHGMNYAARSGILAADACVIAKKHGGFTDRNLSIYKRLVDESFIMRDLEKFSGIEEFVWDDMNHAVLPGLVESVFKGLFTNTGEPKENAEKIALRYLREKKVGPVKLAKFAMKARKSV